MKTRRAKPVWYQGYDRIRDLAEAGEEAEIEEEARRLLEEMDRRKAERRKIPDIAQEIVKAGYRHLASKRHPDKGGDMRTMQDLNAATAWLRERIERAAR